MLFYQVFEFGKSPKKLSYNRFLLYKNIPDNFGKPIYCYKIWVEAGNNRQMEQMLVSLHNIIPFWIIPIERIWNRSRGTRYECKYKEKAMVIIPDKTIHPSHILWFMGCAIGLYKWKILWPGYSLGNMKGISCTLQYTKKLLNRNP